MWNNGDDVNECGEPVELYLPVQAPPRKSNTAPQDSHIGGHHSFDERFTPCCDTCGDKMCLMSQLRLQKKSSETGDDFLSDSFALFHVRKKNALVNSNLRMDSVRQEDRAFSNALKSEFRLAVAKKKPSVPVAPKKSSWYDDNDDGGSDDDDWGMGGDDDVNLENAVAAMEKKLDEGGALVVATKKTASKTTASSSSNSKAGKNAFDCYLLKKQSEPRSTKSFLEDEDDVGLSESDEKIRNMLARYMAEEDDKDILAALGGANGTGSDSGGTEEDERLSEEDRVLRGFQDRQRRAPRQVIRYADGGKPLWSIPEKKSGKVLWSVPQCTCCGEEQRFEFQVLPTILDALAVEKYQAESRTKTTGEALALHDLLSNGLNFGSIAVFTCSNASCGPEEKEASLVIQKSVDDLPEKGNANNRRDNSFSTPTMAVVEDLD
eukprot:CAMPEP_0172366096 /NCGR_PEP_ID=MMETSP1060-20121228/13566_1 /TAXON_ID=37318 /ORGANISM="Pseudo-nitzschia pungens, Strain cf. cingulata" /LENGTH=434 /DNA_ID=CAMNT_0013089813 /DNA_START=46 /DNA_END=1348 /DNA_ORIENTATION=+